MKNEKAESREDRLFERLHTVMQKRAAERKALALFADGLGTPKDAREVLANPLQWSANQYRKAQ